MSSISHVQIYIQKKFTSIFRNFAIQIAITKIDNHHMSTPSTCRNIAIFASGNGSNAENIINYFNSRNDCGMKVVLVVTNRADAYVIERATKLGVPTAVMDRQAMNHQDTMLSVLSSHDVDIIVLAGFLLMVPSFIIKHYHDRIVNIHPSLLPRHSGKGMYGRYVHQAVLDSGDTETGITIHMVSEEYDSGRIIFQKSIPVNPADTADDIERKVRQLEQEHFPKVIKQTFSRHRHS